MTIFSNPASLRPLVPSFRLPPDGPGRILSRARNIVPRLPVLAGNREAEVVRRVRLLHHQLGLEDWSDLELKAAIQQEKAACTGERPCQHLPERTAKVFAIVNESISRRLGAWRILEEESRLAVLAHPFECAGGDSTSEKTFSDEKVVARTLMRVRAAGQGRFGPELLLSADFYRAVGRLDASGRYRFLPTDQQLLAGLHLLSTRVADMQAGEGKTVAIAFAAVMQAVLGRRIHIHTANDYLAERDCRLLAPVYRSLGLTVSVILEAMDNTERRAAYACDIVYGTIREFGFDYLRDNLVSKEAARVQPPLQVAIVDEADQALIDEGDTPLIIAGPPSQPVHPWRRVDEGRQRTWWLMQEALCRQYAADLKLLFSERRGVRKAAVPGACRPAPFRRDASAHGP